MNMRRKTKDTVFLGMLFALSIALSYLENGLAAVIPVPGIKLGLSNIVVMYCVFFLGTAQAYTLAALKSLFVFLTRGVAAASLSLGGGLLSVTAMLLVLALTRRKASAVFTSVAGGIMHNAGQIAVACALIGREVLYYLPVLMISGILAGIFTGVVHKLTMPYFKNMFTQPNNR